MASERKRIGLREVRALDPGKIIWDTGTGSVSGFGARRQRGPAVIYFVKYRTKGAGRQRWHKIGRHGAPWTPDAAREEATRILGTVAAGGDPAVERFMHDVAEGKTAARAKGTKRRGLARVTGGRTAATRTIGLLGAIFTYAVRRRLRSDNPARGIERFADRKRERRLSDEEYAALGAALRQGETEGIWPPALAAVRFLALTGWRSGEALALQWSEIDLVRRTARLADTKTGTSMRPLSHPACDVLKELSRIQGQRVFPAARSTGPMAGFPKLWARIAKLGSLPGDVTPHVLRHSFASLAGDLGYSEPTIAALVGHKGHTVTSRYVHAADTVLLVRISQR